MLKLNSFKQNHPIIIGSFSALLIGALIYFLGHISGYEAKKLIQQSIDNFSMLCNTVTLASATILALLLTALSTSRASDANIKAKHYKGIIQLTSVVTFTFIMSLFSFLLMLVPITETDKISITYYSYIYWILLIVSSLLVGLTITIGLMLRKLIINITRVTALRDDATDLLVSESEEEELKEEIRESQ